MTDQNKSLPRLRLLPYRQEESFVFSADDLRVADCECDGQDVPEGYTEQIAAFITRACNSHYDLLEAAENLQAAVLLYAHTATALKFQKQIAAVRAAIAKAREGL